MICDGCGVNRVVKIKMKNNKQSHGVSLHKDDIVKAVIGANGYALFFGNQNIKIGPNEYEIYIKDDDFNKLLTG